MTKKSSSMGLKFLALALLLTAQPVLGASNPTFHLRSLWTSYTAEVDKHQPQPPPPIRDPFNHLYYGVDRDRPDAYREFKNTPQSGSHDSSVKAQIEIDGIYARILGLALLGLRDGYISARQFNDIVSGKLDLANYESDRSVTLDKDALRTVLDRLQQSALKAHEAYIQAETKVGRTTAREQENFRAARDTYRSKMADLRSIADLSSDLGIVTKSQGAQILNGNLEWRDLSRSCQSLFR